MQGSSDLRATRRGGAALVAFVVLALGCKGAPPPAPVTASAAKPVAAPEPPPFTFASADVDAGLRAEWLRVGVTPRGRADDAQWLRRAYVDLVGTIPPPDIAVSFVRDGATDKRAKMVEALLASPAYADHWMNYWDEELLGRDARGADLDRGAFRRWLRKRFAENASWDRIVTELLTATGTNSVGGPRGGKKGAWFPSDEAGDESQVNGAVNWTLRYEQAPQDLAGIASKTFLGVQIQCAQCHDHKTEKWKQDDFWRFAAAFARTRVQRLDDDKGMGQIRRVELTDLERPAPRFQKNEDLSALAKAKPAALDGTPLGEGKHVREALAAWITRKDNPYFARAFVNRMWGQFLGRGFTDPVNDMRPSNPPQGGAILDGLAKDFASHGYDVRRVMRTIALSEAYQLLPGAPGAGDPENKLWSRFRLTPLGPEELLNAIFQATSIEAAAEHAGFANKDQLRVQLVKRYSFLFDVDEDADSPSYEGTVSQALALLNGSLVGIGSSAIPGSALEEILDAAGTDAQKIEKLTLRTLGRAPTAEETERFTKYVASPPPVGAPAAAPKPGDPLRRLGRRPSADPRRAAFEDVFWALLNSSEFAFNH
jgi:Protein of unknown function (DUF1549)/Protein of unknown function (DUF1553)